MSFKNYTLFLHLEKKSVLITFISQFNSKADILMERLCTLADGKNVVTLLTEINHATLDAIAQASFVFVDKSSWTRFFS